MPEDSVPPHSPFGIVSFILSLILIGIGIISSGAILLKIPTPYGNWPTGFLGLDVFCGGPAAVLIGIPLGLIGVLQKRQKKQFAVMGLILNLLFSLGVLVYIFVILPLIVQY